MQQQVVPAALTGQPAAVSHTAGQGAAAWQTSPQQVPVQQAVAGRSISRTVSVGVPAAQAAVQPAATATVHPGQLQQAVAAGLTMHPVTACLPAATPSAQPAKVPTAQQQEAVQQQAQAGSGGALTASQVAAAMLAGAQQRSKTAGG